MGLMVGRLASGHCAANTDYMDLLFQILYNQGMHLDGIDVFVEVVEAGSFTRAAQRLRMPPATVSAKIARLESRLGVTLIQRTTRKLHVTEAGRTYFASCARALAEVRQAQQELSAARVEPSGRLRITAPLDLSQTVLPPIVERFLAQYPRAAIEMVVTNRRVDLLAEGIDIALRAGPLADSGLVARKLFSGKLGLWASPDYVARAGTPRKPADLERHALVTFSTRQAIAQTLRSGRRSLTIPAKARIRCDDMETVRRFVGRGNGIGLLPELIGAQDGLVRILPGYVTGTAAISLVYPAQRFVPPVVRAFISCATEYAARELRAA